MFHCVYFQNQKKKQARFSAKVADILNRTELILNFAVHDYSNVNSRFAVSGRKQLFACNFAKSEVREILKTHADAPRRALSESAIQKLLGHLILEISSKSLCFRNGMREVF